MVVSATPDYSTNVRSGCLQYVPSGSPGVCNTYRRSDRYAGFHLVWAYDYEQAQTDSGYLSKIKAYQSYGSCCGYGKPIGCDPDNRSPPPDRLLSDVPSWFVKSRQTCGSESSWYLASGDTAYLCSQAVNPDASSIVIGGCKYEMPLGSCKDSDPTDSTLGCAAAIEDQMNQDYKLKGLLILTFSSIQVIPLFEV